MSEEGSNGPEHQRERTDSTISSSFRFFTRHTKAIISVNLSLTLHHKKGER